MSQQQTIDVDTLVKAALNARKNWQYATEVVALIGATVDYLIESGVNVTCDGRPYRPLSPQSWGRLVEQRGLLADEPGALT